MVCPSLLVGEGGQGTKGPWLLGPPAAECWPHRGPERLYLQLEGPPSPQLGSEPGFLAHPGGRGCSRLLPAASMAKTPERTWLSSPPTNHWLFQGQSYQPPLPPGLKAPSRAAWAGAAPPLRLWQGPLASSRAGGSTPHPPTHRHLQSPVCKAFRHVKVDTLSQPEAFSRILVPGTGKLGVQGVLERRETQGRSVRPALEHVGQGYHL